MEATIKCGTCLYGINPKANFCESCGAKSSTTKTDEGLRMAQSEMDLEIHGNHHGQKLIFIGLIILCSSTIYHFSLGRLLEYMDAFELYDTFEPVSLIVAMVAGSTALLIAFGLNKGRQKIIGIVFAAAYTFISLYWLIDRLMPEEPDFVFFQF